MLEALWLAAAIILPLALNPWGGNAFELPKALLLRALVLLMAWLTLVQLIEGQGKEKRAGALPRSLRWPPLALGLILVMATLFSVNPCLSLWGSYERQQGLLTLGAYLLLFFLTANGLQQRAQVERLWTVLVWGSAPVVGYAMLQAAGLDPLHWRTDAASALSSTIGRANFLGSYLVLVVPLTAARLSVARRRWSYGLLLAGQLACLALTQARGAWIGLGAAALVFGLAGSVAARRRRLALAVLVAAGLAVSVVLLLNWPDGPLAPLARLPGLERLATLAQTGAGSTAARLTIWRAALPLLRDRPWLGYGPETMRTVFIRVFPPQLVYYQGRHVAVDRAHNLELDLALSAGIAGAAAFGALLAGFCTAVRRGIRTATGRWKRIAWIALLSAVVGHLVDLQFGFDLTASAAVFWLVLALAAAMARSDSQPVADDPPRQRPVAALAPHVLPALATLLLVGQLCLRPLLADVAYGRSQQETRPAAERLSAGWRAVRLWPQEPIYRLGLAWLLMQCQDPGGAEAQLDAAEHLSPDDVRIWAARGELCAELARYGEAAAAYQQVLVLAPNVATYHTALGLVLAQQGQIEEGVAELERAVALDATDGTAYGYLAELYERSGRWAEAAWARSEAARWRQGGGAGNR